MVVVVGGRHILNFIPEASSLVSSSTIVTQAGKNITDDEFSDFFPYGNQYLIIMKFNYKGHVYEEGIKGHPIPYFDHSTNDEIGEITATRSFG